MAEGATAEEMERSHAQVEAQFVYRLQTLGGFGGKADQLNAALRPSSRSSRPYANAMAASPRASLPAFGSATITAASTSATTSRPRCRFLGIESSPAFVREPEGDGCAERFIRTLKENLLWVRHFATVEELRLALIAFKRTYNQTWIIERHGYKTPAQIRDDQIGPMPMAA